MLDKNKSTFLTKATKHEVFDQKKAENWTKERRKEKGTEKRVGRPNSDVLISY